MAYSSSEEGVGRSRETSITIPAAKSEFSWRTKSTIASQASVVKIEAVFKIESWWIGVRDQRIFRLLKKAICEAEHSLTYEILRKVSPSEAELLKDPVFKARVKFRFGGSEFPPTILFKIFASPAGGEGMGGVKYMSGKKIIKPASEAAEDARRQMGNRRFYDQMLQDVCHHHQLSVTDEIDVSTMKEYMQYASNLDETPAYMGGKENTWRRLNLDVLPRHSFLHNLVEFLERSTLREGVSLDKLHSFIQPPTQQEQIEHIKVVSSLRSFSSLPQKGLSSEGSRRPLPSSYGTRIPSRRSRQAQQRVERMRRAYGLHSRDDDDLMKEEETGDRGWEDGGEGGVADWEEEAFELYQWTQELSFEDVS